MSSITSEELNYLIFRYLSEYGFLHTAFNFGYESSVHRSTIDANSVPNGALVNVVQKGLLYLEMEANMNLSDTDTDEAFSFIQPFDLITKTALQIRQMINSQKRIQKEEKEKSEKEKEGTVKDKPRGNKRKFIIYDSDEEKEKEEDVENLVKALSLMDPPTSSKPKTGARIPKSDVKILKGHTAEVYTCAWNPCNSLLASGSGDSTAMIWTIPDWTPIRNTIQSGPVKSVVLKHSKGRTKEKKKDVTAIDWNLDGTLLATGSYDGKARIWSTNGELKRIFNKHTGPIYSIKWNKKNDYLLTGCHDHTAIVWDVNANEWKQPFKFHSGPTLDVDWRNNQTFASSSSDKMIYVCKIGESRPIRTFSGHKGEVNCVKWDPRGSLLASCSNDTTAKIWHMKQEKYIHNLKDHTKEVYTIKWSPTGAGTNNPNKQILLASASFDSTIKLWDVENGKLLQNFNGHGFAVQALSFSPNGEYMVSGSMDRLLHIWSLKDGNIIKTYHSHGSIFEVCWNKEGNRIAACTNNNSVCVLDFRM